MIVDRSKKDEQDQSIEAQVQVETESMVNVDGQAAWVEEQVIGEAQVPMSPANAPPIKIRRLVDHQFHPP